MIRMLTIHNVALIETVSISFHEGMVVLSGETGAGKSIIIDAVNLLLGGRADKNIIRSGCEKASVEAEFDLIQDSSFNSILEREGIDHECGNVVLFREITTNGRNICRINGMMVSVAVLKDVAGYLINVHGQSEHQFLADENKQLLFLDRIGNDDLEKLKEDVRNAYDRFIINHREYARLIKLSGDKERRADLLNLELNMLREINIKPGEELSLAEDIKRMNKSSRIHEKMFMAYHLLGNGEDKGDSLHNLQDAIRSLRSLSGDDADFGMLADRCETLYFSLEDILYKLETLTHRYDYDEDNLEKAENRLESVRKIKRKYGPTEEDVLHSIELMETEFRTLNELDDKIETKKREHKELLSEYRSAARNLTAARKAAAEKFCRHMMSELQDLGMKQTVFEVSFLKDDDGKPVMPTNNGDDRISFMISPNPGEPLKPISMIASGGELSRLMLALKTAEAGKSNMQTMIFDEIDTGISGRIAQAVAEKLIAISRKQQVICISHLPQIAAAADHQYLVYKGVRNQRTFTEVKELDPDQRTEEVARMVSGAQGISDAATQYAAQMLAGSADMKSKTT